ncbi:MAG: hypothetical protein V3S24_08195 [Candidatus Tectomicrobia bacterium]
MQRSLRIVLSALWVIWVIAGPVGAQSERILLIGGNYRLQTNLNSMQLGSGFFGAPRYENSDDQTVFFMDTRLRVFFDFRPSRFVLINYKMEVGDVTFGAEETITDADGNRLPNVGGNGGGPGSDGVNLETKNVYLEVNLPWVPGLSFRGGIIGWGDQFDWAILATDFTGLQLTYQRQAWWAQFTFLKFIEGSLRTHSDDSDWFALDTRYGLSPKTALSASVYFWNDNENDHPDGSDAYQVYAGLKFNTVLFGKALFEVYGVYNWGQEYLGQADDECAREDCMVTRGGLTGSDNQGFMASMHIDYPIGKHWVGVTLHYISGEKGGRGDLDGSGQDVDAFLGLFNSQYTGFGLFRYTGGGGLELSTFGQLNDSTAGLNNVAVSPLFGGGYNGRILAVLRSKFEATPILFFYAAAGLDLAAQENANGDTYRGIEFAIYMHWDILPKLWLRTGMAFMLTGNWWDNNDDIRLQGFPEPLGLDSSGSADDIFQFILRLQYDFG